MDELLPSVHVADPTKRAPKLLFVDWMKLATPTSTVDVDDPCQNHAELKRLLNRHERILNGQAVGGLKHNPSSGNSWTDCASCNTHRRCARIQSDGTARGSI
jgi:hypothetical protein